MNQAALNKGKYLKAPTLQQVLDFISEQGVKYSQFERFYGIAPGTIRQMKVGNANLPVKHWHIVYEKVKPLYGVGHYQKQPKKKLADKPVVKAPSKEDNPLLNELKNKLNS